MYLDAGNTDDLFYVDQTIIRAIYLYSIIFGLILDQ